MSRAPRLVLDLGAAIFVLAFAASDLWTRASYHAMAAPTGTAALLCAAALGALLVAAVTARAKPSVATPGWHGRFMLLVAFVTAVWATIGEFAPLAAVFGGGPRLTAVVLGVLAVLFAVASRMLPEATWDRLRLALVVSSGLFVLSQPLLGRWWSEERGWPLGFSSADADADRGKTVTLLLLLDELNASAASPFVAALESQGLQVTFKAVPSVGDSTRSVVPSMFTGRIFRQTRPCTGSTICGETLALDFARLTATRPDIDVVGFFHPYCSMAGLRSCERVAVRQSGVLDRARLECELWRRVRLPADIDLGKCRELAGDRWNEMVDEVERAVRRVRALREGGLLFAHLPLPHPPGANAQLTMAQHYRANIDRAVTLLVDMLATARASGLRAKVVIFSDHPLRQKIWCNSYPPYVWDGCSNSTDLSDDKVPLVYAGARRVDLGGVDSNLTVFSALASMSKAF